MYGASPIWLTPMRLPFRSAMLLMFFAHIISNRLFLNELAYAIIEPSFEAACMDPADREPELRRLDAVPTCRSLLRSMHFCSRR